MPIFNVGENALVRSTAYTKSIDANFYSTANKHFRLNSLLQLYTGVDLVELQRFTVHMRNQKSIISFVTGAKFKYICCIFFIFFFPFKEQTKQP